MNLKDRVVALTVGQKSTEERKLIRDLWEALVGAEAELKWYKKVLRGKTKRALK